MKKIKSFILSILKPFQVILQRLGRQDSKVTAQQVKDIQDLAQPGDIVLSFEYGRLTSILIKGFFDHAAIVSSKMNIVEAVGDNFVDNKNIGGVREVDFEEWLYKKDYVAVVRPVYAVGNIVNKEAAAACLYYLGKNYDYQFKIDNETIYCSELVYLSYISFDKDFMSHIKYEILPQEYYDMTKQMPGKKMYFELIYDSRG